VLPVQFQPFPDIDTSVNPDGMESVTVTVPLVARADCALLPFMPIAA